MESIKTVLRYVAQEAEAVRQQTNVVADAQRKLATAKKLHDEAMKRAAVAIHDSDRSLGRPDVFFVASGTYAYEYVANSSDGPILRERGRFANM